MADFTIITDESHRSIATDVREKIQLLKKQLRLLRAVERYHLIQAGEVDPEENGREQTPVITVKLPKLGPITPWHEAAAIAIKKLGQPPKIGEMADYLQAHGFRSKMSRRRIFNGLYVALKRRDDMFEQIDDARWKLKAQEE